MVQEEEGKMSKDRKGKGFVKDIPHFPTQLRPTLLFDFQAACKEQDAEARVVLEELMVMFVNGKYRVRKVKPRIEI